MEADRDSQERSSRAAESASRAARVALLPCQIGLYNIAMNLGRANIALRKKVVALVFACLAVHQAAAATCESLSSLKLPETTITAAQSIPAGTYIAPNGQVFTDMPAFCRVAATLTPTRDSDIGIEVW